MLEEVALVRGVDGVPFETESHQERIYTHGEKEIEAQKKLMENGIPVNDNTMVEVYEMCQYLNMDFSKYFGAYVPEKSGNFKSPEVFK